jgi:TetR/AcrR family transcriptional regulator, transcriptional repressor for nem operon
MSKAEQTKAFIIEKTAGIFNVKGYAGTSISDLTEATGLTKGSIYGNFSNKDEVALAAFDHNLGQVTRIISGEMQACATCREKLMVYVNIYGNFQNYPFPEGGCPLLNTAIEADDTHHALKAKVVGAINAWKKNITGLISKGIANKEFRKGTDAEATALTIIAMIEGSIMVANVTRKQEYRKMVMRSVEKIIREL